MCDNCDGISAHVFHNSALCGGGLNSSFEIDRTSDVVILESWDNND